MTRRGRRAAILATVGIVLSASLGLVLFAMRDTIVYFRSPGDISRMASPPEARFRLGGLVAPGSLRRGADQVIEFAVTDGSALVPVRFRGLLPDLFREGQGVVTEGRLDRAGLFVADSVLARHDETYMPREVADALKAEGKWRGGPDLQASR